jgi:ATP-dependent DNA helicase RecQ
VPQKRSTVRLTSLLKNVFGIHELRPGQRAVIDAVLAGTHTLAIMPTGAGKSLCYQVPALIKPGMTVVISPLIALMRDQLDKLRALGLPAVQINSAATADEIQHARARIGRRKVEFVFTTPEQLASGELRSLLSRAKVDLLVIDEAHCISQWGHDFRPAYLEAITAVRTLGTPTVLALTATAPQEVVNDITRHLGVGPLHIVNTGAHRPNLSYRGGRRMPLVGPNESWRLGTRCPDTKRRPCLTESLTAAPTWCLNIWLRATSRHPRMPMECRS